MRYVGNARSKSISRAITCKWLAQACTDAAPTWNASDCSGGMCAIVRVRVDGCTIKAQAGHPDVVWVVSAVILQVLER